VRAAVPVLAMMLVVEQPKNFRWNYRKWIAASVTLSAKTVSAAMVMEAAILVAADPDRDHRAGGRCRRRR